MLAKIAHELVTPKFLVVYTYLASVMFIHFRGKVRLRFMRQLTEHSGLFAPYNSLMYLFSKVPTTPFLDVNRFPELAPLRENWETIAAEAKALYENDGIRSSERNNDLAFLAFKKRGWKRFYIHWYDEPFPSARELCPKTTELVQSIPMLKSAAFTLLPPGAILGKHRDPFAGSLRYHLGLVTPNSDDCCIWVDGEKHSWRDGQDVVFDETCIHWAQNETDQARIIFFADITRPLHTPVLRWINDLVARYIIKQTKSHNVEGEPVGLLNRLTPVVWDVRCWLQKLKKERPPVYVGLKVLIAGTLLTGLFFGGRVFF